MKVKPHLPLSELKRLERCEKNADRARRLRIVILGLEGWTAPAVAMAVGLSRRICQRWVRRYNDLGTKGLDDCRGQQSRSPLSADQEEAVRRRIDSGATDKDEVCSLRGKDIQRILAEEFGVIRSLAGVYHLLHRMGYSYLRPRPRHRKADPVKVASAGKDNTIRLWNAQTGTLLRTLNGHAKAVRAVAFSPDGQTLATGSYDKTVKLWHAESGQLQTTLEGHPDTVRTVAFSPNGKTLAVGGAGIKLWDLAKGQAVTFPAGHK